MNGTTDPLASIVYLSIPSHLAPVDGLAEFDSSIPLPVQKTDADVPLNLQDLNPEMLIAGMLSVLAYDTACTHAEYYRKLLEKLRPSLRKELCKAAIFKAKNEDFDLAEELFILLCGLAPNEPAVLLNTALFYDERAEAYRRVGLEEDAEACDSLAYSYYKKAMASEPGEPDAFFNAGFFFLKQRHFSRAKDCFDTYLTLTSDEEDENSRYKRTRAREMSSNIAARNLENEHFKAAFDYISSGKEEEGLGHIRLFLNANPRVWNAWFLLGWGLRRLGRWQDARSAFEQALSLGSDSADLYNELAICCMETGSLKEAKRFLSEALTMEGDNIKIISNLGYLALKEGHEDEAEGFFRTVLEIEPNDPIAACELEKLTARE